MLEARLGEEARLGKEGRDGRSWFDAEAPQQTARQLLTRNAAALGVTHLVQGHQHQAVLLDDAQRRNAGQMFQWRGLLFLIDVGMSEGVGVSQGAVLRIHKINGQEAIAICADGTQTTIWSSRRSADSGGAKPCGISSREVTESGAGTR
jgi:hypothetical protein